MLEDEVKSHIYSIIHRPVGLVGKLQRVQELIYDAFEVGSKTREVRMLVL